MKVYTFTTGGCRDGIYLDKLSTTKEGVKDLIRNDEDIFYLDSSQKITDIYINGEGVITVTIYDGDIRESFDRVFDLVIFEVI